MSSSDDENTPPLSLDTSKEGLIKHQARKNTLAQENEALHCKLADISNNNDDDGDHVEGSAHRSKCQRTHNPTPTDSDNESLDDSSTGQAKNKFVNNVGHKFCIIHALWVCMGANIFKIKLEDTYNTTQRFENDDNKVQGQLQEIFMKGLNTQHSNTASRIHHNCSAIFGILNTDLVDPEQQKAKFHGHIGWVPNKGGGGTYSSVDVDIIHKGYSGKYELSKIFLSPVLMALFVALIRGPTTARNFMLGNTSYHPQTETIARIHGIRNTTPGVIATCAILARWVLSSDVSLQEVGSSTGIHYFKDYEEYLTLLETGLQGRKKTIVNIFKEWDAKIFPETDSSLAGSKPSKDDAANLKVLMESLEDDTDKYGDNAEGSGSAND